LGQIINEFLSFLQYPNLMVRFRTPLHRQVTREQFFQMYQDISAAVEEDGQFLALVRKAWGV